MGSTTAARERPILFSDAMVRAILDGVKTVTRRPVKHMPEQPAGHDRLRECIYGAGWCWHDQHGNCTCKGVRCPYGAPGDRLYVREAWCLEIDNDTARPTGRTLYRADGESVVLADGDGFTVHRKDGREASPWKPSIHMPRRACRLLLEVTAVRVERVQAITEEDARAEGFEPTGTFHTTRDQFAGAWDAIYGAPKKGEPDLSWAANPWVWVVEFRKEAPRG